MEPERKIEKWLRSYAKKRRGQAVDFKLDPAARQRLQNEVSRNAPSDKEDDDTMSLWQLIRQQWAFLVGFAACIFLVAMVFFWSGGKKEPMQLSKAPASDIDHLKEIDAPPPTAMPAAQSAAPQSEDMPVMAPPPATAAAKDRELSDQEKVPEREAVQNYAAAREAPALQNAFMNTIGLKSQSAPVLQNFHVEQNGNAIRVVDQDGSVYVGILRMASPTSSGNLGINQNAPAGQAEAGPMYANNGTQNIGGSGGEKSASAPPAAVDGSFQLAQSQNTAQNNSSPSQQNYTFRVIGFNRTLKQNVQFTATLLGDIAAAQNAQMTFGLKANAAWGAQLAQSMQQYQAGPLPWSNLCITGTAIVNRTNQVQVNATPVPTLMKVQR